MQEMYFTGQSLVGTPICMLHLRCWLVPNFVVSVLFRCNWLSAVSSHGDLGSTVGRELRLLMISHVMGPNTHPFALLQFLCVLSALMTASCGQGRQTWAAGSSCLVLLLYIIRTLGLRVSRGHQDCATPGRWALVAGGVMGKVLVGACFAVTCFLIWANCYSLDTV